MSYGENLSDANGQSAAKKRRNLMNNLEKKIKEKFPEEDIEVISFTIMKEPAKVKCKKCNTEYQLKRAENFVKSDKKCICRNCVNNKSGGRLSLEEFQKQVKEKYPNERLQVLNYTINKEECTIKCLKCNNTYTLKNAYSFLSKEKNRVCNNCIPYKITMLNDLKQRFLDYLESVDKFELITDIQDNDIRSNSIIKSKCKQCGNISGRTMNDYMRGRGCPVCANNQIYTNEQYQKLLGDEYTLLSNYKGMEHKVLLRHNLCGFCYSKNARHFYCPKCSGSIGEKKIAFLLEKYNILYEREKIEDINNHKLRFDFFLPDYDAYIEFQGEQHTKAIDYFGGEQSLIRQQKYDDYKKDWIIKNNKELLIINYDEDVNVKLFNFLLKFNDHLERE